MTKQVAWAGVLVLLAAQVRGGEPVKKQTPLVLVANGLKSHFAADAKAMIDADYRLMASQLKNPDRPVAQLFQTKELSTRTEREVLLGGAWLRLRIGKEPVPIEKELTVLAVAAAGQDMVRAQFLSDPDLAAIYLYDKKTRIGLTHDRSGKMPLEWWVQEGIHRVEFEKTDYKSLVERVEITLNKRVVDRKLMKK